MIGNDKNTELEIFLFREMRLEEIFNAKLFLLQIIYLKLFGSI